MNGKPKMLLHAPGRNTRSSHQPSAHPEQRVPAAVRQAAADFVRDFYDRQARTDAAVRTIPGLRNFGR
jgi:hypothetical protein